MNGSRASESLTHFPAGAVEVVFPFAEPLAPGYYVRHQPWHKDPECVEEWESKDGLAWRMVRVVSPKGD